MKLPGAFRIERTASLWPAHIRGQVRSIILRGFLGPFSEFRFTIDQLTAEANRVVISAHSAGIGARGVQYQNVYHIHIEGRDAKLHSIHEMFDPYEVTTYLEKIG